jgi:DNA-binding winged helix-turn-helix (wHTH) protein
VKAFEVGEWRVQPSLNRLTRGAQEVRVEPKVMSVLEALADTPGEVVTRELLVEKVWPGVFVSDDVVHRAIRELRRAFGDDTAHPTYVETIRKRGYRLIPLQLRPGRCPKRSPPPAPPPAPAACSSPSRPRWP